MVEHLDSQIGELLAAIERAGIAEDTIVIFTNDNGGEWLSSSAPFFGRKWTVFEGGIRVPAIVRWPKRIPAGSVSDQVGITMDLTASILAVTGATVPADTKLEGVDLFPCGRDMRRKSSGHSFGAPARSAKQTAVRRGDWKLIVDGPHTYVFDLRTDLSERKTSRGGGGTSRRSCTVAHELGSFGGRRSVGARFDRGRRAVKKTSTLHLRRTRSRCKEKIRFCCCWERRQRWCSAPRRCGRKPRSPR